ncbi:hypothetical protein OsJ_12895 [Oryza sativa Japonica Group]|uniref:DUF1618 domain-containing protein n=1 Tax=Oryza sativa subsp. japonica TaxID=39947 RepID=B9F6E2_ORYSJ|nr:hypothetical protein OsJ_12895 [Oryza sativa Japonica Group]
MKRQRRWRRQRGNKDGVARLPVRSPGGDNGGGEGKEEEAMREESTWLGGGGGGRRGQRGEEYRTEEEATTVEPQTVVPVVAQPLLLAAPSSSPRVASSSSPLHCSDYIDGDYAKKQGLLSLDLLCESKRAWGFDDSDLVDGIDTESMMEYVKVQVRVTDAPNLSFLTMTLGGDEEEKAVFPILHAMDRNLLVFDLSFPDKIDGVYLIYDTIGKTLSMIPALSSLSSPDGMAHTTQVLIARRHAAVDDGSYALALLGKMGVVDKPGEMPVISWPDVIYQWRPSSSISPWKLIKNANLPQQWMADKSAFSADMAFSFEGHAFWDVDFDSIDLPLDCLKFTPHSWTMAERQAYRTVGCTGNSIKLISMHFSGCVKRGAPKVTVWRLEVYANIWVKEHVLNLKTLWTQPAFLAANLPMDMAGMYPVLSMHEEHVICFMCGEYVQCVGVVLPSNVRHFLRVDMLSATLVSSAPIPSAYSYAPVVVPSDLTSYIPPTAAVAFPTVAPTVSTAAIATVVSPPNVPASPASNAFALPDKAP